MKKQDITTIDLPRVTIKINVVIFFLGVIMLLVALMYDVNFLRYKSPIVYKDWKKITWADFRAIKRPKQTLDGSQDFAFICSEISCNLKGNSIEVITYFHPARSYTFNEEIAGESLMKHELCHLHITEYHSRLLRKKLLEIEFKPKKSEIIDIIEKYRYEERKMQYIYDDETYHGYVLGEQKRWEREIDSLLLHNKKYYKTTITFKEKNDDN